MIIAGHRRLRPTEDGFTLIELSVAMFITLLVLAALAGSFIGSLSGVALAKQRQAATGLATGVMEQLRATDYGTLSAGMTCSDVVGDPRVSLSGACASGVTATFTPGIASISEPLVLQVSGPAAAPIVPHIQPAATTKIENVAYGVSTYVSKATLTATSFDLARIHRPAWVDGRVAKARCPCAAGELVLSRDLFNHSRRASGRCESVTSVQRSSMIPTSCRARVWRRSWSSPDGPGCRTWSASTSGSVSPVASTPA